MPYLINRNGTFWFQIRVPKVLAPRYGTHIRQNLSLTERSIAQAMAYRLASHWLTRFACDKETIKDQGSSSVLLQYPRIGMDEFVPEPPTSPPHNAETSASQNRSRNALGIKDSFDDLLVYWRKLHPDCSPSTYKEATNAIRDFKRFIRKRPSKLQRTDVAAYRDKLIVKRLARSTVAKRISFIATLLQTAYDAGALPQNVARGLRIPKGKVETVRRRAFTPAELEKIFQSPIYQKDRRFRASGGEAAVWLPVMALATGARLEELSQLKVTNIILDKDHGPMIRISDEGEGQRVKTTSSRRTIPVHPELVKAGLLVYWEDVSEARQEWLFPDLEPDHDGRRGGTWGQWFSRYLRRPGGCNIVDRSVVFHSFRHTFKTLCREAQLPEEVHDALTGHVTGSVGRGYGHVPLSTLVEAVGRIRFPVSFPRIQS